MTRLGLYWKNVKKLYVGRKWSDYVSLFLTIAGVNLAAIVQIIAPQSLYLKFVLYILTLALSTLFLPFIIALFSNEEEEKGPYIFDEKSGEEADFFARWYSKPGELTVFCTDLDWLDVEKYKKVKESLIEKSKKRNLVLYLKKYQNEFVDTLVKVHHAELHKVRNDIRTSHRFSILEDEGDLSIIIRNKDVEANATKKVRIEEYNNNNSALINVALDMLDDCEIRPKEYNKKRDLKRKK